MKLFDLSHPLNNESPVYPGIDSPQFISEATIENQGYRETRLNIHSHLGTHIDAPAHMLKKGNTLEKLPISAFIGNAIIIEVEEKMKQIDLKFLQTEEKQISETDFVLFKTRWSRHWGNPAYFDNFPTLTMESVNYLLHFSLKGIGFDAISADPIDSTDYKIHFAILGKGLIIIENLIFPDDLNAITGEFSCFPLPFENADGSPVRAVLKTL